MSLPSEPYADQAARWPREGRHILAHFDAETVVVYQAYSPAIARYALKHGRFGGAFSYTRMSWIKPNFLWMMYRSGWGTKAGQEMTLGLRIGRPFFEDLLARAVASSLDQSPYADHADWKDALRNSEVRLQWDPDHDPHGKALPRRAIQLGLRGSVLKSYGRIEIVEVIDLTDFVRVQRARLSASGGRDLETPKERIFKPTQIAVAKRLRLD